MTESDGSATPADNGVTSAFEDPADAPEGFAGWSAGDREAYLDQRAENAAGGRRLTWVYGLVTVASRGTPIGDPWDVAAARVGAVLGSSGHQALRLVAAAVHLSERMPETLRLLTSGWVGLAAAFVVVEETQMVADDVLPELDREIAERLGPTRKRAHPPRLGPLRRMVGGAVNRHDEVGATARAREARRRQDVRMDRDGPDVAEVRASLTAEDAVELMERVEHMVRTADPDDPRTRGQLRAAGLLALARGWAELPRADVRTAEVTPTEGARQVVLHVYGDELEGYGPLTAGTLDELRSGARVRVHDVAGLCSSATDAALRHRPSEALRRFVRGRDGTCVFPGCTVPAEHCDLDHIVPFDHEDPTRGGRTTGDDLACLCRRHHRLKTEGRWAYHREADGGYRWIEQDGAMRVRTRACGPFAHLAEPRDPGTVERQRTAAESAGPPRDIGPRRPTRRERREERRRSARAWVERAADPTERTPWEDVPPPF